MTIPLISNSRRSIGNLSSDGIGIPSLDVPSLNVNRYAERLKLVPVGPVAPVAPSIPSIPSKPLGITKSKVWLGLPVLSVTIASVPASPVVVVPIDIVSAVPSSPVGPVGPVAPINPIAPVAPVGQG